MSDGTGAGALPPIPAVVHGHVVRAGTHPAVIDGAGRLSYADLWREAAELAALIAKQAEASSNRLVAIQVGRDRDAPIAMLAVLMAGCAFVPIAPAYPRAHRELLLADSGAQIILVSDGSSPDHEEAGRVAGIGLYLRPEGRPRDDLPADLAYVIYTSGTTGRPKGCMVEHASVLALLRSTEELFRHPPGGDVWAALHSFSFDVSVWEVWGALVQGGTTAIGSTETMQRPAAVLEFLRAHAVTILSQTPSMFAYIVDEAAGDVAGLPDLRWVVLAGEAVKLADVQRWVATSIAPEARVVNMHGITEVTIYDTFADVTDMPATTAPLRATPIGNCLPHLGVSVRDDAGAEVADGEPGELWFSGSGVAAGYLGQPDLTSSRFVTVATPGGKQRQYRSGDMGYRSPDGSLHCIGRRDDQIKLRGYRIELGEIESALRRLPAVRDAACVVGKNSLGHELLFAHLVESAPTSDGDLRTGLRAVLPAHMCPQVFVRHDVLPVTANGKLDRKRLTQPADAAPDAGTEPEEHRRG
jgi:nonribosomal peptide synthetase DhbF